MNIQWIWSVLCERSVIDIDSNNISLFNVLEEIAVSTIPPQQNASLLFPLSFELVTLWARAVPTAPAKGRGRTRVIKPDGELVQPGFPIYDIDLSQYERIRVRQRLLGLPISESGTCWFSVDIWDDDHSTWQEAGRVPIKLKVEVPEQSAGN